MGKKSEYARLLTLSADDLRSAQDEARRQAEADKAKATRVFSFNDFAVGRDKDMNLHLAEGARAFREGEQATDDGKKRQWYARAILEYRDATLAAGGHVADGSSLGQTLATAGTAVKEGATEIAKGAASGLENIVIAAVIAYFVSQAVQGVARGR